MSHYILWQVYQGQRIEVGRINHPGDTISVDIVRAIVAGATFYLTAHDTEGFRSDDSDPARCDTQECIDRYLIPGKTTGVDLEPDSP